MKITIEPTKKQHIVGFHRTLDSVARERKYLALTEAPSLEKMSKFVDGFIKRGDTHFVALLKNDVIGWCDITRRLRPTECHVGSLGMGVLPEFRGKGIGRQLITAAIVDAHAKGIVRIELTVFLENKAALNLYETIGFEQEGVLRDLVLIDGEFRSAISMALIDRSKLLKG